MDRTAASLIAGLIVGGLVWTTLVLGLLSADAGADRMGVEVLDCRNRSTRCERTTIARRPASCDIWQPWDDFAELNCTYTDRALGSVSLVADPANYIDIPMTDATYTATPLAPGAQPWDLEPLPSGALLWTNRPGGVKLFRNGSVTTLAAFDIPHDELSGLLGLAVHPRFAETRYVYLFYTARYTNRTAQYGDVPLTENRISRFTLADSGLSNETVLLTVPGSPYHSGGRLEFGPDGYLYVTTGDADMVYETDSVSFLGGKILRLNPDGSVPADNPFPNSPVYSMGHRNPQGLAWHPGTADLYATEHGPWRHDEINRIVPGGNYGWSTYKCTARTLLAGEREQPNTAPVVCFKNWTLAPSGAAFVDEPGHPWYGDLFVAGLRGKQVFRLRFEDGEPVGREIFYTSADVSEVDLRLRDVEFHDGSLYAVGDDHGVLRITPQ